MRDSAKLCGHCHTSFSRTWHTDKQWDFTKRCDGCEREHIKSRLLAKIIVDTARGCWLWQGSLRNGYGQISIHDAPHYAHRLSYELFVAPLEGGQEALHSCDVRPCINPEHLFAGTHLDNIADMLAKGRGKNPPVICGRDHHKATLTEAQIQDMVRLRAEGWAQRQIAKQFRVSQSTVWRLTRHAFSRTETVTP